MAILRVYNTETEKLVSTMVTDRDGRYQFVLNPGKYYLIVSKDSFEFPSRLLNNREIDGDYSDLYYGRAFELSAEKSVVNYQIAMDPNKKIEDEKLLLRKYFLQKIQLFLCVLGPVLAVVSFIVNPSFLMGIVATIQIALFFVFRRIAYREKISKFGIVRDKNNQALLSHAIVRVFEPRFNKLLDTRITNYNGKYSFLVGSGQYYLTSQKTGYRK